MVSICAAKKPNKSDVVISVIARIVHQEGRSMGVYEIRH